MSEPLGMGESQEQNAAEAKAIWREASIEGPPEVGACVTHEIERIVTPLDGGGERVEIKLHPPRYYKGPAYGDGVPGPEGPSAG